MKNLKLLSAFILFVVIFSCQKEESPPNQSNNDGNTDTINQVNYFKLEIGRVFVPESNYYDVSKWVFFYDLDNNLIGSKKLSNNSTYEFETIKENCIIQFVEIMDHDNVNYSSTTIRVDTYIDVKPDVWKLGVFSESVQKIGEIILNTNDIPLNSGYRLSTKECISNLVVSDNQIKIGQYSNPDKLWFRLDNGIIPPKYIWYEEVSLNSNISITMDDLSEMEFMSVDIPEHIDASLSISGNEAGSDCMIHHDIYSFVPDLYSPIGVYFPSNVFNSYYTSYWIRNGNIYEYYKTNTSEIPSSFQKLDMELIVNNTGIKTYKSTPSGEADYYQLAWGRTSENNDEQIYYNVYGNMNDIITYTAPSIPNELPGKYSDMLNLDALQYNYSSFIDYSNVASYNDFIFKSFVEKKNPLSNGYQVRKLFLDQASKSNLSDPLSTNCVECSNN